MKGHPHVKFYISKFYGCRLKVKKSAVTRENQTQIPQGQIESFSRDTKTVKKGAEIN